MTELVEPPPPPAPVPAGWEGILEPGETVLWQGQPDGRIVFLPVHILTGLFGLAFAGFALIWMAMAAAAGGLMWMFGLIHFTVGLVVMIAGPLGGTWKRRRSFCTLTSRRAFIASTSLTGAKTLKPYPITSATALALEEKGPLGSVIFHREQWRDKDGNSRSRDIGFEQIAEGRKVMALMRQVQEGQA